MPIVRARKEYACRNCHKPILKGTLYLSESTKVGNQFFNTRQHVVCGQEEKKEKPVNVFGKLADLGQV